MIRQLFESEVLLLKPPNLSHQQLLQFIIIKLQNFGFVQLSPESREKHSGGYGITSDEYIWII
jgi:hypothetical protein